MWKPGVAVQAAILNVLLIVVPSLLHAQVPPAPASPAPEQPAAPPPAAPAPPTPGPESVPAILENNSPTATVPRDMPRFTTNTDLLNEMEADRLANERYARRWALVQRREFIEGANHLIEFRRVLAHMPVGSETPTAAAMKNLTKQSEEVQKRIPKIIEYLGGKKTKNRIVNAAAWHSSTDAALDLLSALRRVNPELERFARNEHQFDAAKSRRLIEELELVQQLLQKMHQSF